MVSFTKGDIVIFPFPYTDLSSRKIRPCLILSNEMSKDLTLCQITSRSVQKDDFSIELKKDKTLDGSLDIDSYIRTNMIFTANKSQIIKLVCRLNEETYKEVVSKINQIISK